MLVIRKEQYEQFEQAALADFKARLLSHLLEVLPALGLKRISPDQLRAEIDEGLERGPRYRIRTEQELSRYIEAVCVSMGGFEPGGDSRELRKILNDHRLNLDEKLSKLAVWAKGREAQG